MYRFQRSRAQVARSYDFGMSQPGEPSGPLDHEVPVAEPDLAIVTMRFDASDAAALAAVLAKYVVLTRMEHGCRNVDLCASVTRPGRYLIIEKWDSPSAQRAHFDGPVMVEMARSCAGLLSAQPDIDLWDGPSAHDLA
jgi:quinol monooxygenase YgiN